MQTLSILHIMPSVGPGSFGVGAVALNLALEQIRLGHNVEIWSVDTDEDKRWASDSSGFPADMIRAFKTAGPSFLKYSPHMEHDIRQRHGQSFDVIHQHGIWTAVSRVTNIWRRRTSKPTVIAPHGSLQEWCIRKSAFKKKLALLGYENCNFAGASCFHVLAESEMLDCQHFGLSNPIAVIPNGVSMSWMNATGNGNQFRAKCGIPTESRIALFMSRITPKKGLPMLFAALDSLGPDMGDWVFLIAGVDEFYHENECRQLVKDYGLQSRVKFVGALYGDQKLGAFAAADLFVLPSYSEGAPIVILEALAAGVPVVATKASPWADLIKHKCGWWTEITSGSIATALKDAMSSSPQELVAMGSNGRRLVSERYTWQQSAVKTIALYNWLINGGIHPQFVETDPH